MTFPNSYKIVSGHYLSFIVIMRYFKAIYRQSDGQWNIMFKQRFYHFAAI